MTIPIIAKFQKAFIGSDGLMDAVDVDNSSTGQTGILNGASTQQDVNNRLDGTGVGASIFRFTGSYAAQNSNISEWFGGRQLTRLRCTDNGGLLPVTFTLPGSTALGTAFDTLVTRGLPEVISLIIEYTGSNTTFLQVVPRSGGPNITGTTSIIVRSGIAARVEVTRTNSVISEYVFESIGAIGADAGSTPDSLKLINPSTAIWDASASGSLPTTGVVKGNAYKVVNAPSDGSGRFGEIMADGDWVVWEGETFTAWATEPHAWFVLPAHEVRRISALEDDFLNTVVVSTESDRNTITRGADYADAAGEIRLKIYNQQSDYSAADLNTTGDVDEYTDASDQNGYLAIRLTGNQAALASVLPTLWVYAEDPSGTFTRLVNLENDFAFMGDFGAESDYLTHNTIHYSANATLRIYVTTVEDRYNSPDLDILENNLSAALQAKVNRTDGGGTRDGARLSSLETKVASLFPLTADVHDLVEWSDIFSPENLTQVVRITDGYSLIADYRGPATKYESAGVVYSDAGTNVVTYTGLGTSQFRGFGFKVTGPADQVLMWIVDGTERIPFVDMTAAGNFRLNNYTPATTEDQRTENQLHELTRTGDTILRPGTSDTSTYTITNFPANATDTSRRLQVVTDVLLNGTDTLAGHFVDITLPADNTAQLRQTVDSSVYLGPLYNNRTVTVTLAYTLRVSGADLVIDISLVTAPSDVTIRLDDVDVLLSYTAPADVARVDNFVAFNAGTGAYTFTGENELIFNLAPHTFDNNMEAIGAAIGATGSATQFNNVDLPTPAHSFESVEIPDTTALSGFEFRTYSGTHYLSHSEVAHLLERRAMQWCYGLALLNAVTEHAVTEVIDFTQGIVLISPNSTRYKVTVADDGTLKTEVVT